MKKLRPDAPAYLNPHPSYDVFADAAIPTKHEAKATLGLSNKKVLLFFGYVRAYKGLNVMLESMQQLPDEYHLLIVGEFYQEEKIYEEALQALKNKNQVTVVDRYVGNEEVPALFLRLRSGGRTYLTATQSGVIQIAYGFSRPVVASAVGGIPEAVVEGKTGYLVPPDDAVALTEAIQAYSITPSPDSFDEHIALEQKKYSWDRMVETIESMAKELKQTQPC